MICSRCQRSGYGFPKIDGKIWCGSCETAGTRTLGRTTFSESGGSYIRGAGSLAALPNFVSLTEWQEVAKLCRNVSGRRLLIEDGPIKTLPLPTAKNPLDGKPSNKRLGWTPLEDYMKNIKENKDEVRSLFEG